MIMVGNMTNNVWVILAYGEVNEWQQCRKKQEGGIENTRL